ncbi:uncharacterized protein METZ01_LOCUS161464 [marine metagenome]|uniref:DUF1761 domain-containing protein n=1 Tax=marine metagenome TaxID=408172 RepID=A0A382B457_9ZZZZ|tara:strand:- start:574 stop:996 length:423 start_codon:yes stop_codon:yes gene_type:complete
MDTKRVAIGTVVGSIAMFVAAYLIWSMALPAMAIGDNLWEGAFEAAGVGRESPILWAFFLANVPAAALITLAIERGASSTIGEGVKVAAIVGFLLWASADLAYYGSTTIFDLTSTIVDPLLATLHFGIGGGVIAAVLGRR